jgi:uncharacterized protein
MGFRVLVITLVGGIGIFCFACASTLSARCSTVAKQDRPKTHDQSVEVLFELLEMDKLMGQVRNNTLDAMVKQNPLMIEFRLILDEFLDKHVGWESVKPEFIALYMEAFTKREIDALIDFYNTKVGKKAIATLPGLTKKGMQIGAQKVEGNIAELQQMIADELVRRKQEAKPDTSEQPIPAETEIKTETTSP